MATKTKHDWLCLRGQLFAVVIVVQDFDGLFGHVRLLMYSRTNIQSHCARLVGSCHSATQEWTRHMAENKLFYGDNLEVLRQHIASESVDLVYLDPPFNSARNYN